VFNALEHHVPLDVSGRLQRQPETTDVDAVTEATEPPVPPAAAPTDTEALAPGALFKPDDPLMASPPLTDPRTKQTPFKPPKKADPKKKKAKEKEQKKKSKRSRKHDTSSSSSDDEIDEIPGRAMHIAISHCLRRSFSNHRCDVGTLTGINPPSFPSTRNYAYFIVLLTTLSALYAMVLEVVILSVPDW
jgi:hypothetical protein